jgi:hypothetical protein
MTVARCFAYGASASSSGVLSGRLCHRWHRSCASTALWHQHLRHHRAIATMRESIARAPRQLLEGHAFGHGRKFTTWGRTTAARSGDQEAGQRRRAPAAARAMIELDIASATSGCHASNPCVWPSCSMLLVWPGGCFMWARWRWRPSMSHYDNRKRRRVEVHNTRRHLPGMTCPGARRSGVLLAGLRIATARLFPTGSSNRCALVWVVVLERRGHEHVRRA